MRKIECDRCKAIVEECGRMEVTCKIMGYYWDNGYDLCRNCIELLRNWVVVKK